jgi:hypothetical protein
MRFPIRSRLTLAAALFSLGCATRHDMGPPVLGARCPEDGQAAEIRWVSPEAEGDREALSQWCELVGDPVILPQPGLPLGSSAEAGEVIMVTWNVWVGGGDLERFLEAELGWVCGDPAGNPGVPPFVIFLQEAFRRGPSVPNVEPGGPISWGIHPDVPGHQNEDMEAVARDCGLALAYFPSSRNGSEGEDGAGEDKGNAIVTSMPLRDIAAIELPFEAGRKVAVVATVEVPVPGGSTMPLGVASVHLDVASTLARTLKTGNQTRVRQVRGFLEGLNRVGPETGPFVVGNTWGSRDGSLKEMLAHFPDSPPVTAKPTRGPFPPDHIFFRAGPGPGAPFRLDPDSYQVIQELYGSDHNARRLRLIVGG